MTGELERPAIPIEVDLLLELLERRDDLVRAIQTGTVSGSWDQVMGPFDALMVAIKRLEEGVANAARDRAS